ncbi:MAG: NADPH-dependent 7-cyano-7-deazaguanine reductase QueF [Lentisphaerales bacterium]|jgi:7-cyano-7-deazaguanine reductase|nr:MAG: NADPH-dependent 7-cyano-7-deazaguanine reductase QueF [Lentisphaerales bacterium]
MAKRKRQTSGRLSLLGKSVTPVPASPQEATLEAFENKSRQRDYIVRFDCPEFTSLCPITGQPDFGSITIEYVPARLCLESKSLKLYLFAYRNEGIFHEEVVNRILRDVVKAIKPRSARIEGTFRPRGGISITVRAAYPTAEGLN